MCYAEHQSDHKCIGVNKTADGFRQQLQTNFIDKIEAHILQTQQNETFDCVKEKDAFEMKILKDETKILKI